MGQSLDNNYILDSCPASSVPSVEGFSTNDGNSVTTAVSYTSSTNMIWAWWHTLVAKVLAAMNTVVYFITVDPQAMQIIVGLCISALFFITTVYLGK
jgi:hypothetical protein